MKVSKDLLFIANGENIIIYNSFIHKVVMVEKNLGEYLKMNQDKEFTCENVSSKEMEALLRNGIVIDDIDRYLKKQFHIKRDETATISSVYFHVTQRCNLNCTYCYNKGNLNSREELSTDKIFLILNKLKNLGVKIINFTGGEALIRDDIIQILKMASKMGFKNTLLTNGIFLKKKREVFKYIESCIISIDNIDEQKNKATRVGAQIGEVLEFIENSSDDIKEKITVRSVICRGYELDIKNNKIFFEKLGVKYIANMCLPNSKEDICRLPEVVDDFCESEKGKMCSAGEKIIAIDSNGDVYPCQTFVGTEYFMGNILEEKWAQTYLEKKREYELLNMTIEDKQECTNCEYKFLCLGGCPNLSYRVYHNIYHSNDFLCELYKKNVQNFLISIFEGK